MVRSAQRGASIAQFGAKCSLQYVNMTTHISKYNDEEGLRERIAVDFYVRPYTVKKEQTCK